MTAKPFYDQDFYAWTWHQAGLLREGALSELDLENLAEEIESLGKRDRRELGSRLQVLIMHLLKWRYQPERHQSGQSWRSTIRTQRIEIGALLQDSPSLRPQVTVLLTQRYPTAQREAAEETQSPLSLFPTLCPWTVEQVLNEDFWPEP